MRELSVAELDEVSGAMAKNFFDFLGGVVVGSAIGGAAGMTIGGIHGGDGGGIFGLGSIGQLVGIVVPTVQGAWTGAVVGGYMGMQDLEPAVNNFINQMGSNIWGGHASA